EPVDVVVALHAGVQGGGAGVATRLELHQLGLLGVTGIQRGAVGSRLHVGGRVVVRIHARGVIDGPDPASLRAGRGGDGARVADTARGGPGGHEFPVRDLQLRVGE